MSILVNVESLNIESLKKQTIDFLNWFSEYNLVPLGMALKLHLLSGNAIEKQKNIEYQKYHIRTNKEKFYLSDEQEQALKELVKHDNSSGFNLIADIFSKFISVFSRNISFFELILLINPCGVILTF